MTEARYISTDAEENTALGTPAVRSALTVRIRARNLAMGKTKRVFLTYQQKGAVVEEFKRRRTTLGIVSYLREWAQTKFHLCSKPSSRAIRRVLQNSSEVELVHENTTREGD